MSQKILYQVFVSPLDTENFWTLFFIHENSQKTSHVAQHSINLSDIITIFMISIQLHWLNSLNPRNDHWIYLKCKCPLLLQNIDIVRPIMSYSPSVYCLLFESYQCVNCNMLNDVLQQIDTSIPRLTSLPYILDQWEMIKYHVKS